MRSRPLLMALALCVVAGVVYATLRLSGLPQEGALDAFGQPLEQAPSGLRSAAGGAGLLLLGSWLAGLLASRIGLPKISGYLLFGVLMGPSLLALVGKDQLGQLEFIQDLAVSVIALTAGGEIRLALVRRSIRVISLVTGLVVLTIAVGVGLFVYFAAGMFGDVVAGNQSARIALAAVVGSVAAASSPAAVIAVLAETRAEGRLAQLSLSVAVAQDLVIIALFAVVITLATPALERAERIAQRGQESAQVEGESPEAASDAADADDSTSEASAGASDDGEAPGPWQNALGVGWKILLELVGSALVGAALGAGLSWMMRPLQANLPVFVVLVCFGISVLSSAAHLDALIVALAAGLTMANTFERRTGALFDTLEELSLPVYCMFFAVSGAKVDLQTLASIWPAACAIVAIRTGSILLAAKVGTRLAGETGPASKWLWTAFVPQAGIALALAALVASSFEHLEAVDATYSLLLATIAIHELIGPVLLKIGLGRGDRPEDANPPDKGEPATTG